MRRLIAARKEGRDGPPAEPFYLDCDYRKPMPQPLIRNELVEVKPMALPEGLLFYLDYNYNDDDTPM